MTMKIILYLIIILVSLSSSAFAETTFFDNENDVFIMSDSPADSGVTEGGSCKYKWDCTNWSACFSYGKQTRNCTNIGTCSDKYKSPETEQNCIYAVQKTEEDKELEKENVTAEKQNETEDIIEKEIVNENEIIYFVLLIIVLVIFYLKKYYFKKQTKKKKEIK